MSNQNEKIEELENEIESLTNKIKNVSDELNKLKTIKEENKEIITKDNCVDLCFNTIKEGSDFYYINIDGEVCKDCADIDYFSYGYNSFIMGNYYKTKEEAELEVQYRKLYTQIKCYAKLKGYLLSKEQIGDENYYKYYINYSISSGLIVSGTYVYIGCTIFKDLFFTLEGAKDIIKVFKEEILEYYNKKWGSDNYNEL